MSQEKKNFIAHAFIVRCASGQLPEQALKEAHENWNYFCRHRPTTHGAQLDSADVQRRVLEALVQGPLKTVPNGPRLRELLANRIRERHGTAPGTNRLNEAVQDLKGSGRIWMSLDRRSLQITKEGEVALKEGT